MHASSQRYATALARFKYEMKAVAVMLAAERLFDLMFKAGYRPNQPRVPAGNPDGGRWTAEGSDSSARVQLVGAIDDDDGDLLPDVGPDADFYLDYQFLRRLPSIHPTRPIGQGQRFDVIREIMAVPAIGSAVRAGKPPSVTLERYRTPKWIREYYPHMDAYFAKPKTLLQLQADALRSIVGHDRHHLVEKTQALREGYSRLIVDSAHNIVSISRFKHWEITAWYTTKTERFGNLSPREYLRGKGWNEKMEMAIEALKEAGVLRDD